MTHCTAFGEHFFPACHYRRIRRDVSLSLPRIGETKGLQFSEEGGDVVEAFFGSAPENRMLARVWNFKRFLRRKPDQSVVTRQPILGKHADVHVHTNGCSAYADGIRAI